MAVLKVWTPGERLTAADLNGNFLGSRTSRLEGFLIDNVAAGVTDGVVGRFVPGETRAHICRPIAGRSGRVVAVAWRLSAAITAGTLELRLIVGGAASALLVSLSSASGTSGVAAVGGAAMVFAGAQALGLNVTSSGALAPAAALDLAADLIVEYEA